MTLISSHFERIAARLKAEGEAAKSFHHSMNRGLIREAFVREFLAENTSGLWGVGSGEIIHPGSTSDSKRNQIDVIIYNRMYPKISVSTGIDLFLSETVSSFIEVKSKLRKEHLDSIAEATKVIKSSAKWERQRLNPTGLVRNPRPYSFVFAYDGPKNIHTVLRWLQEVSRRDNYNLSNLRQTHPSQREFFHHTFIDGVFLLGRGFVLVDSLPFQSFLAERDDIERVSEYIWLTCTEQELTMLWTLINTPNQKLLWNELEITHYLGEMPFRMSND